MYKEKQKLLEQYKKTVKITKEEDILSSYLDILQIRYLRQKGFFTPDKKYFYIVDFYIPKPYKFVLEVDGNSHNGRELQDYLRDKTLLERDIQTYRFTNPQVYDKQTMLQTLVTLFEL